MKTPMKVGLVTVATLAVGAAFAAPVVKTQMQKVSYAIGYNVGSDFKAQKIAVDPSALQAGLKAGLSGAKPVISKTEMKTTLRNFQQAMMKKAIAKQAKVAAANTKKSSAYMSRVAVLKGVKKLSTGIYYKVIKAGHGAVPTKTDTVVVNYSGRLIGGKVFDSSYKRGKPATFRVDQVIPGWSKALQKMPVGSTWMLYIAPKQAYGKFAPPVIGPNQALTFKVQLLSIKKAAKKKAH